MQPVETEDALENGSGSSADGPHDGAKQAKGEADDAGIDAVEPAAADSTQIQVDAQPEKRKGSCRCTRASLLALSDNLLALSLCGQLGIVARDGLTNASKDVLVAPLFSSLSSNMLGSFAMGLLCDGKTAAGYLLRSEDPEGELERDAAAVRQERLPMLAGLNITPGVATLLLGLRTGFCGSFTTFSSWNQDMVAHIVHGDGADAADAVVGYVVGLLTAVVSVVIGQMAALYIQQLGIKASVYRAWPNSVFDFCRRHPVIVRSSGWALLVLLVTLVSVYGADLPRESTERDLCFALIFGPFGVILRWKLSQWLNPISSLFPLGTFTANMLGAATVGIFDAVQDDAHQSGYWTNLQLASLALGFCGSLSTVSTFVTEIVDRLKPIPVGGSAEKKSCTCWGVIYPFVTLVVGFLIGLATYGWSQWTK